MLNPLIQLALKLKTHKIKNKISYYTGIMESIFQSVMCYNSYKLKVGKQKCINRWKINQVEN